MLAQLRLYEIGMSQCIAHNLFKYHLGLSTAYTVDSFLVECKQTLLELGISNSQAQTILQDATKLFHEDLLAVSPTLLQMAGGSECTPYALLCGPAMQLI